MTSLPEQWEARLDLFMSLKESVDGLKYLDFDVGDDLVDKDVAVDILNYLDSLCEQQRKMINYLKAAYEVDNVEDSVVDSEAALTAINLGDSDCPESIPDPENPGVMLTERNPRFNDKFFYARKHLILHFTKHANWRVFCRGGQGSNGGVTYKNAIIAAVYGKQIETNLYWDPNTNVAVALYGPVYDPDADYTSGGDMIQKVLTVFDRTNQRALAAYKGYMQLLEINRKARLYETTPGYEKPEQLSRFDPIRTQGAIYGTKAWFTKTEEKFQPPRPFIDIIKYTKDDIPTGMGRSTARQTADELQEFNRSRNAYKPRRMKDLRINGHYNMQVMYSPEGVPMDDNEAKYRIKINDAKQRYAEGSVVNRMRLEEISAMGQEDMRSSQFNQYEREKEEREREKEERRKIQEENRIKKELREQELEIIRRREEDRRGMAKEDRRTIDLMNARRAKELEELERLKQEELARREAQRQKDKAAAAERSAALEAEKVKKEEAAREAKKAKEETEKAKKKTKKQRKKENKQKAAAEEEDFDALLAEFTAPTAGDGEYFIKNDKGEACLSSSEDGSCSEHESTDEEN